MKRIATYIAVFVAMIVAAACTMNEFFEPTFPSGSDDNVITIRPRISHFADCNVSTRSAKEGDEAKVTSMAMALFPIEGGQIQPCVYYQYNDDGNMLFVLDRNRPPFTDAEENEPYKGKEFVMYVIANMQGTGIPEKSGYVNEAGKVAVYQPDGSVVVGGDFDDQCGAGWTVAQFVEKSHSITPGSCFEKIHENGLPMIGSLGDRSSAYGDNNTFVFHPDKVADVNENGLPTVNGTPTDNLEIPMRSLYAKFTFTISVDSEQEVVGNAAPRFNLNSYQVVNAAKTVFLNRSLNEDNDETGYDDVASSETHNVATEGLYAQGATKATFSLYVPERTFGDGVIPLDSYVYDFGENGGECVGYDAIPPEMKKYAQRFKPELAEGLNATHVEINGTFTDHQKHIYNVTYKIYLGADNYGDFDIIRNTHYNNFITIKGIDNSDDESANYDPDDPEFDPEDAIAPISIDHRVSVERTTPLVVGLRRETLLDAHIEVRPLRLHLSGGDQETNPTSATVTLMKARDTDPELSTWIGMEMSGNTDEYITETDTPSDGKRKYFTTDLIASIYNKAEKNADGNIVLTVDGLEYDANQTVWLYVDENTTTTSRSAILRIQYDYEDPVTGETAAPMDYVITQHGLYEVSYGGRTFYIERFEEYLYNYDVEDVYGQTKEEGMPWGLEGVQLSNEYRSFTIDEENTEWKDYLSKGDFPKYDFYIEKHDGFAKDNGALKVRSYAGQEFTSEIYTKSQGKSSSVDKLTMAQQADGAVEYCYNRNKRNADGSIAKVEWYLPSADELEDIMIAGYSSFKEFQDNYYWTSQPAYIRNVFYYEYTHEFKLFGNPKMTIYTFTVYDDNPEYARATKVVSLGNDDFDYAKSGLNETPDPYVDHSNGNINFGYYYMMYKWKRTVDILGRGNYTYERYYSNPDKFNGGEEYDYKFNSTTSQGRYHAHLGHLLDMKQEGYQPRSENNRVRCAYKSN